MANLQNLKPFKKGQAYKSPGRPKGSISLPVLLNRILYMPEKSLPPKYAQLVKRYGASNLAECLQLEKIDIALMGRAKDADKIRAAESLEYRLEGAPTNTSFNLNVTANDDFKRAQEIVRQLVDDRRTEY